MGLFSSPFRHRRPDAPPKPKRPDNSVPPGYELVELHGDGDMTLRDKHGTLWVKTTSGTFFRQDKP